MLLCAWQGMEWLVDYDYIAIFDADFKPDPDFLVGGPLSCCARLHALCGQPWPKVSSHAFVHHSMFQLLHRTECSMHS